ncbi:hypothetical protein [Desulfovibrio aminophilus]|uniref:hypothetical protein n=1 Tax=Desulfovibrio aminophilus TaxID=81425 RepID=UPI000419378E|nr:hypothetical protein [Desulfovibrio aminophilus]
MKSTRALFLVLAAALLASACVNPNKQALATSESQVQLRSIQSRAFDTTDKEKTLRTVIATLQDLGFVIDKADGTLGTVSATKLSGYQMRMTVTVQPKGTTQTRVRANAQLGLQAVEAPLPYQQFFQSLEKAMFLTANLDD